MQRVEVSLAELGIGGRVGSTMSVRVRWVIEGEERRVVVRAWPMKPEAPVMRTLMFFFFFGGFCCCSSGLSLEPGF